MKSLIIIIAFFLFIPQLVYSHVDMREKSPSEDAILETAPEKVVISFYGSIEPTFSKIEVFNQHGDMVSMKTHVSDDGSVMEASLPEDLKSGEYTVKWLCISMDGHKMKGSYKFIIK